MFTFLFLAAVALPGPGLAGGWACPAGTFVDPYEDRCVAVHDVRAKLLSPAPTGLPPGVTPPTSMNLQRTVSGAPAVAGEAPIPGGIGAGTLYTWGRLTALKEAVLVTKMIVYPYGIDTVNYWLYTTATNRTQRTVEVVGMFGLPFTELIGLFDWSCMDGHPCDNGNPFPSWVWFRPASEFYCNTSWEVDDGGFVQQAILYANGSTKKRGDAWVNYVLFRNYCDDGWDVVYTHEFVDRQSDCSQTGCSFWGPILETFVPRYTTPELGFFGGMLYHDGQISHLDSADTYWAPPEPYWKEFYRIPNRSWGVGTPSARQSTP